jgi:Kiwa protein KwaB-like
VTTDHAREVLTSALGNRNETLLNSVLRGEVMATAAVLRFDVVNTMAEMVRSDVWAQVERLVGKQFIPYDPSYQTSAAQVLVEDLAQIPDLAAVDAVIRRGDFANDAGGEPVVAMAHAVGAGDHQVVAYRVKGPGIATRRAKGVLQLVPRNGVYQPIDEEVLYYEPRFDAFTCGGMAYFVTVTLIQSKLNAPDKARALARDTLRRVTNKVTIEGLAELEQAVMDDQTMRAKMAQIARLLDNDPEYAKNLTTKKLVDFADANGDYDIPIAVKGRSRVLQFDSSPQRRHQIPKLLADDYLRSELTNRNYEAGSKHRVTK